MNEDRSMGLTIRDMKPDETEIVSRVVREAYAEYEAIMAPAAWRGLRAAITSVLEAPGSAEVIVAVERDAVLGCVFLFPVGETTYGGVSDALDAPEIRMLSVPPSSRGRGVARALVEECVCRSTLHGAREVGLHTSASMTAARALYRSMGFERRPELDFSPPGAELVEGYRLAIGGAGGDALRGAAET
jgi:ribosomal protein S18 acetylase RimI-like enzyme